MNSVEEDIKKLAEEIDNEIEDFELKPAKYGLDLIFYNSDDEDLDIIRLEIFDDDTEAVENAKEVLSDIKLIKNYAPEDAVYAVVIVYEIIDVDNETVEDCSIFRERVVLE